VATKTKQNEVNKMNLNDKATMIKSYCTAVGIPFSWITPALICDIKKEYFPWWSLSIDEAIVLNAIIGKVDQINTYE